MRPSSILELEAELVRAGFERFQLFVEERFLIRRLRKGAPFLLNIFGLLLLYPAFPK